MSDKDIYWSDAEFAELCGYKSFQELKDHEAVLQKEYLGGVLFKPVDFQILLRLPTRPEVSAGGIISPPRDPSGLKFHETVGRILAFGSGAARHKGRFPWGPDFKLGDLIHFQSNQVRSFRMNDYEMGHIFDASITAILTEEGTRVFLEQNEMAGMKV